MNEILTISSESKESEPVKIDRRDFLKDLIFGLYLTPVLVKEILAENIPEK